MAIIAITTSNSISVKAFRFMFSVAENTAVSRRQGVKGNRPEKHSGREGISPPKVASQLRRMDYASRGGGVAGGSVRQGADPGSLGMMIAGETGGLSKDGLRASQKSSLVSTFNRVCFCSDFFR